MASTLACREFLAHVDRRAAAEVGLGPVDAETDGLIKPHVGCEGLIGQQAQLAQAGALRLRFGMVQQMMSKALALMLGRDRDVLDEQVIGREEDFYEGDKLVIGMQEI